MGATLMLLLAGMVPTSGQQRRDPCFEVPSEKPDVVIQLCSALLAGHPNKAHYERALNRRGLAYFRTNRHRQALADFDALVASSPSGAGYIDNRRAVHVALGNYERALADANEAIRLMPKKNFSYHGRGDVYFAMGRFDLATEDYSTAYQVEGEGALAYCLHDRGRAYAKLRRFDDAIRDFTSVILGDPGFSYSLKDRAFAYLELGQTSMAELDLVAFLQREPGEPEATAVLNRLRASATSNPLDLRSSSGPATSPFVDRTNLLTIVGGFLSDAGITAYKVLPPEPGSSDPHLRWVYEDGALGELMALKPGAGVKLVDVANKSIEREAAMCKGEFATARLQSRYFKGSEVQRVETRCRSEAGLYAFNFSIIELPSGAMLRFGSLIPAGGASEAASERTTSVENAAMLYVGSKGLQ